VREVDVPRIARAETTRAEAERAIRGRRRNEPARLAILPMRASSSE
jgi:hypothetical protein